MKFSFVNGIRQEPTPKQKGACCVCGSPTIAKCGNRKVWHWAHVSTKHCDSWWENETEWHRLWKTYFPQKNQEVIHFDEETGEKHIADIKTDNGMVIEIQNSPMNEQELSSREKFYGKMMWIVNGDKFKNNFVIWGKLPKPSCEFAQDIEFHSRGWGFHRKSENPNYENWWKTGCLDSPPMVLVHSINDISEEIDANYIGHHLFDWKRPRYVWFKSTKPVFIDFGCDILWWLQKYDDRGLMCVRKIYKEALIKKNGGCYRPLSNNNFPLALD